VDCAERKRKFGGATAAPAPRTRPRRGPPAPAAPAPARAAGAGGGELDGGELALREPWRALTPGAPFEPQARRHCFGP